MKRWLATAFIHHELMSERLVLKHQHRQKVKPGAKAWPPSLATSSHTCHRHARIPFDAH
jgi:hypothetical protein